MLLFLIMGIKMKNYRLAVFRGGPSQESELAMENGAVYLELLNNRSDCSVVDVIVTKQKEWLVDGIVRNPSSLLSTIDYAIISICGIYGEDGTIQRILERHGVPYLGSRPYPSFMSLMKNLAKERVKQDGLDTAPYLVMSDDRQQSALADLTDKHADLFDGASFIIKPVNSGSGLGVCGVSDCNLLEEAIDYSLQKHDRLIIEKEIPGMTVTCGILENFRNQDLYFTPVIETAEQFSHNISATDCSLCQRLPTHTRDNVQAASIQAHKSLGLSQISRSDFRVTPDGEVVYLETNTLPAITPGSPLQVALQSVGAGLEEFLTIIPPLNPYK